MATPQSFFSPSLLLIAVVAAAVGVPAGRALRSSFLEEPSKEMLQAKAGAASKKTEGAKKGGSGNSLKQWSDDAVESEVLRLAGGSSQREKERNAEQIYEAITAGNGIQSDLRRFAAIYEAVAELGRDSLADALSRARAENNVIAERAIERRWAELDPLAAAQKAAEKDSDLKLGSAFYSAWSRMNPEAAINWLTTQPADQVSDSVRAVMLQGVTQRDPKRALELAAQMQDGVDKKTVVSNALNVLAARDPAQAVETAKSLPEGEARSAAMNQVIGKLASTDIEEAKRLLSEMIASKATTGGEAGGAIAVELAKTDPQAAADWASSLPSGTAKDGAFAELAREWAGKDLEAAAKWLDALPAGSARDGAVASFAMRTAPRDPEGATIWAATLPPGDARMGALSRTLSIWMRTNSDAVTNWIASAPGFSDEERQQMTQAAQRPPFVVGGRTGTARPRGNRERTP